MPALVALEALDALFQKTLSSHVGEKDSMFAAEYQRKKVFSKFTTGSINPIAEKRALEKFLTHSLMVRDFKIGSNSFLDRHLLDNFRRRVWDFFDGIDIDCLSLPSLHKRGGVGPGASIGAHGTDFLRKLYYGPVSASSLDVLHSYIRGCASNPLDLAAAMRSLKVYGSNVSQCSRISFVEKNIDEARTIATEPSANMFYQLAVASVIDDRLFSVYRFSKAKTAFRNRNMAYLGSIGHGLATIDLQSASDSVSMQLLEFLPGFWRDTLCHYRCEYSILPSGEVLKLPMVSTMGNGWTFSLMTAILYCALHAAVDVGGCSTDIKKCSVFGDDIICPTGTVYRCVIRLLALLGFVVNEGKSFSEGDFRESCGHDYFRGRFVRPVFIRRLDTISSLYVAINRFAEWGAFHSISVHRVLRRLTSAVPQVFIPPDDDPASGIRVPSNCATKLVRRGVYRYSRYEAVPISYDVTDEPVRARSLSPGVNPDGCFVAFLGGYLRSGRISERSEKKVRWRLANKVTALNWERHLIPCPGWDSETERRWKASLVGLVG